MSSGGLLWITPSKSGLLLTPDLTIGKFGGVINVIMTEPPPPPPFRQRILRQHISRSSRSCDHFLKPGKAEYLLFVCSLIPACSTNSIYSTTLPQWCNRTITNTYSRGTKKEGREGGRATLFPFSEHGCVRQSEPPKR